MELNIVNQEFKEVVRNRTGLPWYKKPAPKGNYT